MQDLKENVFDQLRYVRGKGLAALDNLAPADLKTNLLELAAKEVPGYTSNMTRGGAIVLLLEHEIPQVKAPGHGNWLEILFGLRDDLAGLPPSQLRVEAAKVAGEPLQTFARGGSKSNSRERQALRSLAAQIVADCLQINEASNSDAAQPSTTTPAPQDSASPAITDERTAVPSEEPSVKESESSPLPLQSRGVVSHRTAIATLSVVAVLAVGVTAGTVTLLAHDTGNATSGQGQEGSINRHSPEASSGEPTPGNNFAISSTVSGINSTYSAAVPSDKVDSVARFLEGGDKIAAGNLTKDFDEALGEHGYLLSQMHLSATMERIDDGERNIEIKNIHPVDIERVPIPTGVAFFMPSGGGGEVRNMEFYMDKPSPEAVHPPEAETAEGKPGTSFFRSTRITFNKRWEQEKLSLDFYAFEGAYRFKIAIDYVLAGKKYRQYISQDNNDVFKLTADLCPPTMPERQKLHGYPTAAGKERLSKLRYEQLWRPSQIIEDGQFIDYAIKRSDPARYTTSKCPTSKWVR